MPRSCIAWGCTSHSSKDENLAFSIFPDRHKFRDRWAKWVSAVRRSEEDGHSTWEPGSKWVYLCGKHFITGASNKDPSHPDHVPSIFPHKSNDVKRNEQKMHRYSSAKKRIETPKVKKVMMCKGKLDFVSPPSRKPSVLAELQNYPESQPELIINSDIAIETSDSNCVKPAVSSNLPKPVQYVSLLKNKEKTLTVSLESATKRQRHAMLVIPESPKGTLCADTDEFASEIGELGAMRHVDESVNDDACFTATPMLPKEERKEFLDEINYLRDERDALKKKFDSYVAVDFNRISNKERETKYLTGLSVSVFMKVFAFLSQFTVNSKIRVVSLENQFLLTLIKLRLDVPFEYMAMQNSVAPATITKVFWRWTRVMSSKLGFLIKWSDREIIRHTIPPVFKTYFPRLTGIMDCFEIFTERPKGLLARAKLYSNYKKHSTVKVLIVCAPNGAINFMSKCWGGRVSDVELVRQSGLLELDQHMPGDQLLADRGFTLKDDFAASCGVELIIPSFTKGKNQLSAKEVEISRQIATVRIHIERIIGLMRNRYTILKGPVNLNLVKSLTDELEDSELCSFDHVLKVCGSLTNLGDGIVYNEHDE